MPAWLGGCDLGPDYRPPALEMPVAYRATAASAAAAWPSAEWWRGFGSPELDSLVFAARAQNFDIAAAVARVKQADAQVRISGAALLPTVDAPGSITEQQVGSGSGGRFGGGSGSTFTERSYSVALSASYEVDFWGRNRALRQSAVASAVASRFDQQVVALTVVSNVALTWFAALSFADRLAIAENNLASSEQTLRVIQGRFDAGTASALDLAQQQTLVDGVRANIPNFRSQLEQEVIGLGILLGRPPEAIVARPGTLNALTLPAVAPGLPSTLLLRRPDVAEAEANLVAQNANIRAARAAFFPTVQLTVQGGVQNAVLTSLTGPGVLVGSIGAAVTQSIFDGGTLRGQLEQAKGREEELIADYRKAVVQALTDVENALTALRETSDQERLERQAVASAQRAADIARAQVAAGTVDITTVLTAETTLFTDEDLLAQVRLARAQALVDLFKALGGGWSAPAAPILDQAPVLHPGVLPGGVALPVGGNVR